MQTHHISVETGYGFYISQNAPTVAAELGFLMLPQSMLSHRRRYRKQSHHERDVSGSGQLRRFSLGLYSSPFEQTFCHDCEVAQNRYSGDLFISSQLIPRARTLCPWEFRFQDFSPKDSRYETVEAEIPITPLMNYPHWIITQLRDAHEGLERALRETLMQVLLPNFRLRLWE